MLELNTVYNIDCLEGMKLIDDNSIDLIITSPPYNLGNKHHTHNFKHAPYTDNLPEELYQSIQVKVLAECYRILKPEGSILYNHKNRIKNGKQISPYEWLFKTNFIIKQEIIWVNRTPNFDKCRFYPATERIYWLTKNINTKLYNTISHDDVFKSNEWKAQGTKQKHTRAFPIKLCTDLIKCFPASRLIFDPYGGSGTTAVASIEENKDYILFEKEKKYCDLAQDRITDKLLFG